MTARGKPSRLRRLAGPVARRVLLALALAAAWAWWGLGPWWPQTHWSRPSTVVASAALAPSGTSLLAVECWEANLVPLCDSFRLWDLASGRDLVAVRSPGGVAPNQTFAPDGSWLAAQDERGGITLWDTADGRPRLTIPPVPDPDGGRPNGWRGFLVAPDGKTLACCPSGGAVGVQLWDLTTGRLAAALRQARDPVAFAPDGRTLAAAVAPVAGEPAGIVLWDVAGGREAGRIPDEPLDRPLAFSPDGRRLAVAKSSGLDDMNRYRMTVTIRDLPAGRPRASVTAEFDHWNSPSPDRQPLRFSPDGRFLTLRGAGSGIFWDLSTDPPRNLDHLLAGTETNGRLWPTGFDYPLFNPPGTRFVVPGTEWQTWIVYDAAALAPVATCRVDGIAFQVPVISPDGRLLAAVVGASLKPPAWEVWLAKLLGRPAPLFGPPSRAAVYDLTTGVELGRVPSGSVFIGFSPDSQSLWSYSQSVDEASGRTVLEVQQWAVPTGRPPAWLLAVTGLAVLLAVADGWRCRRRRGEAAGVGGSAS